MSVIRDMKVHDVSIKLSALLENMAQIVNRIVIVMMMMTDYRVIIMMVKTVSVKLVAMEIVVIKRYLYYTRYIFNYDLIKN